MKNSIWKKGLAFGIIMLFIGAGVAGSNFHNSESKGNRLKRTTIAFDSVKTYKKDPKLVPEPYTANGEYDLLIVAPSEFSGELQKLIDHKNGIEMKTIFKTTEEIYNTFSGIDKAEQIKYCIKDSIEQWNISYVLLIGGLKKLFDCDPEVEDNWHVPARYSHLDLDGFPEPKYLCDLYFADVYYNNTSIFCDWNSNEPEKGLFGEWRWEGGEEKKDERDLIPDVAVGRLPCRNIWEVKIMVDKIIKYESSDHTKDEWFLRMLLVGGDSYDDTSPGDNGIIEGKYANLMAYEWCKQRYDFTKVGLWPSDEDPSKTDLTVKKFINEQNKGSGFTFLLGHGSCGSWFNHQYYADFQKWTFIRSLHLFLLRNGYKLPVTVVGGCNTANFDKDLREGSVYFTIECFSWMYTRKLFGGSIATIGNTAICKGEGGEDYPDIYNGYLTTRFFEVYGNGTDILGDIWKEEITHYVQKFDAAEDLLHCKTVENWVLLGDPSLRIGGYP